MAAASGAGGGKTGPTVFLEAKNRIVEDFLTKRTTDDYEHGPANLVVGDFDDTTITINVEESAPSSVHISLQAPYVKQIKAAGAMGPADAALKAYAGTPGAEDTVACQVDVAAPAGGAAQAVTTLARIKREVIGSPFQYLFEHLAKGTITQAKPFAVNFRSNETVYFLPGPDRVTIGFGLRFPDATDAAIIRIVCQQLSEVQRTMGAAPGVAFAEAGTGATIPREITDSGLPLLADGADGFTGYVTLSYFTSHVDSAAKMENTVNLASGFRAYLNYHVKAAKSYIHSRMRDRVSSLQQVLSRAHTSDPTVKKVKKTFQGKTVKAK